MTGVDDPLDASCRRSADGIGMLTQGFFSMPGAGNQQQAGRSFKAPRQVRIVVVALTDLNATLCQVRGSFRAADTDSNLAGRKEVEQVLDYAFAEEACDPGYNYHARSS
jgi:hypothetical protein